MPQYGIEMPQYGIESQMVNLLLSTGQAQDKAKVKETTKINEIRQNRVKLTVYPYSQATSCHKKGKE